MLTTTLEKIRNADPCTSGWGKLLTGLGKREADDEMLTFNRILEINGLDDACWCLITVPEGIGIAVEFSRWCADEARVIANAAEGCPSAAYYAALTANHATYVAVAAASGVAGVATVGNAVYFAAIAAGNAAHAAAVYGGEIAGYDAMRKRQTEKLLELLDR